MFPPCSANYFLNFLTALDGISILATAELHLEPQWLSAAAAAATLDRVTRIDLLATVCSLGQ